MGGVGSDKMPTPVMEGQNGTHGRSSCDSNAALARDVSGNPGQLSEPFCMLAAQISEDQRMPTRRTKSISWYVSACVVKIRNNFKTHHSLGVVPRRSGGSFDM